MPTVSLDPATYQRIQLLARAWRVNEGGAVQRLIETFVDTSGRAREETRGTEDKTLRIHAVYEGVRTNAVFDPSTERVHILDGPLAGQWFKTPSGAAVAVVRSQRPDVNPNRNGWTFWTVTDSGQKLQSVRQ